MLFDARVDHGIDLKRSFVVGDKDIDMRLAKSAADAVLLSTDSNRHGGIEGRGEFSAALSGIAGWYGVMSQGDVSNNLKIDRDALKQAKKKERSKRFISWS